MTHQWKPPTLTERRERKWRDMCRRQIIKELWPPFVFTPARTTPLPPADWRDHKPEPGKITYVDRTNPGIHTGLFEWLR